jgi:hypothetical protein
MTVQVALHAAVAVACLPSAPVLERVPSGAAGEHGGGNQSAGGATAACDAPYSPGLDFIVCQSSYFGGDQDDVLLAAAITPEGDVLLGGSAAPELTWGSVTPVRIQDATSGIVLKLRGDGTVTAAARVDESINDLEVSEGRALLATDTGIVALAGDLETMEWRAALGNVRQLAVSRDLVVALVEDELVLLSDGGAQVTSFSLAPARVSDVALDADAGRIFVTGHYPVPAGGECRGSMPFLRAYDLVGKLDWRAYDFEDAPGWCASSEPRRLALAADGALYYAGEQEGGNSVHLRDPHDLALPAELVSYDTHSNGSGRAIDWYSFVGRFDASSGELELGHVILPREMGTGGILRSSALNVDAAGHVMLGGSVTCCLEHREQRSIAGTALGAYAGEEASLLILSPDFSQRLTWTSFNSEGVAAERVNAIAIAGGVAVLAGSARNTGSLIVQGGPQAAAGGAQDGFFVTFRAP